MKGNGHHPCVGPCKAMVTTPALAHAKPWSPPLRWHLRHAHAKQIVVDLVLGQHVPASDIERVVEKCLVVN